MIPISFKANYLHSVDIKESINNKYKQIPVSFVELEPSNIYDRLALHLLSLDWEDSYVRDINHNFTDYLRPETQHVCALTTQEKDLKELEKEKILGVVEFTEKLEDNNAKTYTYVNFLQTNPKFIKNREVGKIGHLISAVVGYFQDNKVKEPNIQYKDIGKGMLKSVENLSEDDYIKLVSNMSAVDFYKKQGYKKINSDNHMKKDLNKTV